MKKLLLAAAALAASTTLASADVILDFKLSGTGDNVVFDSVSSNIAIGSFNGQHTGKVVFTDISGNPAFSAAASGNDIKITNTNDLDIHVFDNALANTLFTSTDVFSLKGSGNVTAFVSAVDQFGNTEPLKTFSLGAIDLNAQSGFTFTAINGELIQDIKLLTGGNITEFEHYRIDVGTLAPVPAPAVGTGLIPFVLGMMGLNWLRKKRGAIGPVASA